MLQLNTYNKYPNQLSGKRIEVIPTCADLHRFQPMPFSDSSQVVIGCIGTVLVAGSLLIGFELFDAVARAHPTARFELVSRDAPDAILTSLDPSTSWKDRLNIASASPLRCPH